MNPIRRILVPVDFSACSRAAFDYAIAIAERVGAMVEVLHVYSTPSLASAGAVAVAHQPQQHLANWSSSVRREAKRTLDELIGTRHRAVSRLCEGRAEEAILNRANAGDFDLIIMGTHGRTGLAHLLRGSVAEYVLRSSTAPVMTIKAEEAK